MRILPPWACPMVTQYPFKNHYFIFKELKLAVNVQPCSVSFWQVQLDRERKWSVHEQQYNTMYYGNPGTGKTTVARLYAAFLKEIGVLAGADIVETTGAALVNGGVTELKNMLKKIEKGGVFFIDEAYQLKPAQNPQGAQVG